MTNAEKIAHLEAEVKKRDERCFRTPTGARKRRTRSGARARSAGWTRPCAKRESSGRRFVELSELPEGNYMDRRIEFRPAFDKRHPDPKKNYGIHGAEMHWYLVGELGAVQFVVYTNWHLPHVKAEGEMTWREPFLWQPMPADLGYHSPKPLYEGQHAREDCHLLPPGCKCHYDGSGLNAGPVFDTLVREGHEAAWKEMENYYIETFGELR